MYKKEIKDLTLKELETSIAKMGYPFYRAKQVFFWLYKRRVHNFSQMSNIPEVLKDKISKSYYLGNLELSEQIRSADKTEKFLFKLLDGNCIETVLIYADHGKTVCLSTQVGCKFACVFCASGMKGFKRNLSPWEITNQILYLQSNFNHQITNYVFMGMGEPLDNYENVMKAIIIMNSPDGMNIGPGRITLSSCGVIPGIEKLKELNLGINLSISLHATNDKLRSTLMPINKIYSLERLIKTCHNYIYKTKRRITIEYVLIKGINDFLQDANELAAIAKKLRAKVNLIPCSKIPDLDFQSPDTRNINKFMDRLINKGVRAMLRHSKGEDIQAACGQLAARGKFAI